MGEVFETTDLDVAAHVLSGAYASMRIRSSGERHGLRMSRETLTPAVSLDQVAFAMSCDTDVLPMGALAFEELKSGLTRHGPGRHDRRYRPGDVFLAAQPDHPFTTTVEDGPSGVAAFDVAVLDPALPSQIADGAPGRTQQAVRFTGYEPVSPQAAQAWKGTCAYIRGTVLTAPDAAGYPLLAATAARLLAATALTAFPNNALTDPTAADRHDAHPDTVRRAVAFIDEHAHEDITVADVAAAAFVTIRAVQLAFRRHLDITPLGYLRRVRLDHARRDLLAARPDTDTVTAIAFRWGFTSQSRFAAAYRQAYGVTPRHSLHQE